MQNLAIHLSLVNGSTMSLNFGTGRELIHALVGDALVGDDFDATPTGLSITAKAAGGRTVTIIVHYSSSNTVGVQIQEM